MTKWAVRQQGRRDNHQEMPSYLLIESYNLTMAKPFKWTYQGKALNA
jgi:hypothetical protein